MKTKVDFTELKKGIVKLGKAGRIIKKSTGENPLIKLTACENYLDLTVNSKGYGAKVSIPAETEETGSLVTTLSSINIITLRDCEGKASIKSVCENAVSIHYKKNNVNTMLTAVVNNFIDIPLVIEEESKCISLPTVSLKEMLKNVMPFVDDSSSSNMHCIKLNIDNVDEEDASDGLLKLEMLACDVKSIALRTSYTVKNNENCTGSYLFLPEQLKTALDMIDDEEEETQFVFTDSKIFMKSGDTVVSMSVLKKNYPDINKILAIKNCSFSISVDKAEMLDALNSILYVQGETSILNGNERGKLAVSLSVENNVLTIGCSGVSSYTETIDVKTKGTVPSNPIYFDTSLLKDIVSNYPNKEVIIGGAGARNPYWFCCGDYNEYVFAAMPKIIHNA